MISAFLTVLQASFSVSLILLLLLLVQPLLGKRYMAQSRYILWVLLALRLLIPVNFTGLSLFTISVPEVMAEPGKVYTAQAADTPTPKNEYPLETAGSGTALVEKPYIPGIQEAHPPAGLVQAERSFVSRYSFLSAISPLSLAAGLWLTGVVLSAVYQTGAYIYTLRKIQRWSVPVQGELETRLIQIQDKLGLKRRVCLVESPIVSSPLAIGFLWPKVVIPMEGLEEETSEEILRHELCHIRRRDLWAKLAAQAANCLHWFNPLIYLLVRKMNDDMELACDAAVLQGVELEKRRQYGLAMMQVLEEGRRCKTQLTTCFYSGKKHMKKRFGEIMKEQNGRKGIFLVTLVLLLVFASVMLVSCDAVPGEIEEAPGEVQEETVNESSQSDEPENNEDNSADIDNMEEGDRAEITSVIYSFVPEYPDGGKNNFFLSDDQLSTLVVKGEKVQAVSSGEITYRTSGDNAEEKYVVVSHGYGYEDRL